MAFALKPNRRRIGFEDIVRGDRLRVRYTEGGSEKTAWLGDGSRCVSVTRVLVAEVDSLVYDRAWLSSDGVPVARRDWTDLEIIRLSEEVEVAPVEYNLDALGSAGGTWTEADLEVLADESLSSDDVAELLGRTVNAVRKRRRRLRGGVG